VLEALPDSPRRRAYLSLVSASDALVDQFKKLFQRHGLTLTQFNLLRLLLTGPESGETCGVLRDRMLHRVPDITRLVDRMERDGLVERLRAKHDRRVVLIQITAEGQRRCEAVYPELIRVHDAQFPGLSEAELSELERLLRLAEAAAKGSAKSQAAAD
jgi:MarR family transcriptional regulator, 2-MHQ and catechol-resistance regulon repressor